MIKYIFPFIALAVVLSAEPSNRERGRNDNYESEGHRRNPAVRRDRGVRVKSAPRQPKSYITPGQISPATMIKAPGVTKKVKNTIEEKPDKRPNVKPDKKPDGRPNVKPDRKPDRKPNVKPDRRPDRRPDRKPDRKPDYRPGYFGFALPRPWPREYYRTWKYVEKKVYRYNAVSDMMQYHLDPGDKLEFSLEENPSTGYLWFARYDKDDVNVSIDHESTRKMRKAGVPGIAEIEIKSRRRGDTVVELIYARKWEWDQGVPPAKVIQLFIYSD